jgi:hypothetical protein
MAKRSGGLKKHCVCPYSGEKFEVVVEIQYALWRTDLDEKGCF